ncbi:hypothetical protein JMJ77_0010699, partial [Colletotrichum scovillei]
MRDRGARLVLSKPLFLITSTFRSSCQDAFRIRTDDSQLPEMTWVQAFKRFQTPNAPCSPAG